jgi:FkbM family methyltransferase
MEDIKFYSQKPVCQDEYYIKNICKYKKNGVFIDIGAHDGIDTSNTYALEKHLNWSGLCVEANPVVYDKLKVNRLCHVENACLFSDNREISFSIPLSNPIPDGNDKLSRIDGLEFRNDLYFPNQFIEKQSTTMITKTLNELMEKYNMPEEIDFMSIDTEGCELDILSTFNFDKYKIKFITIEHGNRPDYQKALNKFFISKNYILHRNNYWDDEYVLFE